MASSPAPVPPAAPREAAALAIIEALHVLHPRIPGITKGDCHCNLLAEVALDAAAPILLAAGRTAVAADIRQVHDTWARTGKLPQSYLDGVADAAGIADEHAEGTDHAG